MKLTSKTIDYTVPTVDDLPTTGVVENQTIVVTDEDRGGVFIARSKGTVNDGTIFDGGSINWHRQYDGEVNVKWFGAVGDGITDNSIAIQNALNLRTSIIIPEGTYIIKDWLKVYSDTTISMNGWLKVDNINHVSNYEAVFTMSNILNGENTDNVTFNNLKIDLNNSLAANGIIFRDGTTNCIVNGIAVKNASHDKNNYGGGRAISIEGGTSGLTMPDNIIISNFNIKDCYGAISVSGNADSPDKSIIISNGVIENCETLITVFGNSSGFPQSGDKAGFSISNITAYNVGKNITYSVKHGIISMDRGCNGVISNIKIYNAPSYGFNGYLLHGEMSNIKISNIQAHSDFDTLFYLNSYAEADTLPSYKYGTRNLIVDSVNHIGTTTDTIDYAYSYDSSLSEEEGDANPKNNVFRFTTQLVSSTKLVNDKIITFDSFFLDIYELTNQAKISGFAGKLKYNTFTALSHKNTVSSPFAIIDEENNKSGGLDIVSYAPVLNYKDLSESALYYRTSVDDNSYKIELSTDTGVTWLDVATFGYYGLMPNNNFDLGTSNNLIRNIYANLPTTKPSIVGQLWHDTTDDTVKIVS